ncbi:MAG: hypothetical protein AB7S54_08730 [Bacteroidales bacterium]
MDTIIWGYWNNKKEKIRQLYPEITQEDLCFIEGKEKIMIEMLEYKLGKSKEELRDLIDSL